MALFEIKSKSNKSKFIWQYKFTADNYQNFTFSEKKLWEQFALREYHVDADVI